MTDEVLSLADWMVTDRMHRPMRGMAGRILDGTGGRPSWRWS